jgi:hypothetical protein
MLTETLASLKAETIFEKFNASTSKAYFSLKRN